VEDQDEPSWHEIPGTVDGASRNLFAAQDFGVCSYGATSCSYTRAVTIAEPGRYLLKANSRDVLYPVPGEAHQASEGDGLAVVEVVVVDKTPPTTPVVKDQGIYAKTTTSLSASWSSSDPESGIAEYQYAIGTSKGATDIVGWISVGKATSVTKTDLTLQNGKTYYFSVKAKNQAGLWSQIGYSDGITVDITAPTIINILDSPDPFDPEAGQSSKLSYILRDNLSSSLYVYVYIYNRAGLLVRTLGKYTQAKGNNSALWNGKDSKGLYVPNGTYKYRIRLQDLAGNYTDSSYYYVTKR
jgi:hypothetical protein